MAKFDTAVELSTNSDIPIKLINESFNWPPLVAFGVTALVVFLSYKATRKSNEEIINNQQEIAYQTREADREIAHQARAVDRESSLSQTNIAHKQIEAQNEIAIKNIATQNEIAAAARLADHQSKISEFRHQWLQDVRNTSSELVEVIYAWQNHANVFKTVHLRLESGDNNSSKTSLDFSERQAEYSYKGLFSAEERFNNLHTKIRLYFKPDDESIAEISTYLNEIHSCLSDIAGTTTTLQTYPDHYKKLSKKVALNVGYFANKVQQVLKDEWEVTKTRSWIDSESKNLI